MAFLATALMAGLLASRLRRQAVDAARLAAEQESLRRMRHWWRAAHPQPQFSLAWARSWTNWWARRLPCSFVGIRPTACRSLPAPAFRLITSLSQRPLPVRPRRPDQDGAVRLGNLRSGAPSVRNPTRPTSTPSTAASTIAAMRAPRRNVPSADRHDEVRVASLGRLVAGVAPLAAIVPYVDGDGRDVVPSRPRPNRVGRITRRGFPLVHDDADAPEAHPPTVSCGKVPDRCRGGVANGHVRVADGRWSSFGCRRHSATPNDDAHAAVTLTPTPRHDIRSVVLAAQRPRTRGSRAAYTLAPPAPRDCRSTAHLTSHAA